MISKGTCQGAFFDARVSRFMQFLSVFRLASASASFTLGLWFSEDAETPDQASDVQLGLLCGGTPLPKKAHDVRRGRLGRRQQNLRGGVYATWLEKQKASVAVTVSISAAGLETRHFRFRDGRSGFSGGSEKPRMAGMTRSHTSTVVHCCPVPSGMFCGSQRQLPKALHSLLDHSHMKLTRRAPAVLKQ